MSLPNETFTYGRRNRPQTPINGIIGNVFGEEACSHLQNRYVQLKNMKEQSSPKRLDVRYTHAQLMADQFIKTKMSFDVFNQTKPDFKLKRF